MKIVTAAEMRDIDRLSTTQYGVPSLALMENAGAAVADFVIGEYPAARRIGVVCGKGNNGGDGFVAARKLHERGREVKLILLADPSELRGDAAEMFRSLPLPAVLVHNGEDLKSPQALQVLQADVLLDAILGTGFRPPVAGLFAEVVALLNAQSAPVVAVDIPSGADADSCDSQAGPVARADAMVTFTAPRPVHVFGMLSRGPIVISPIGSPDRAIQSSLHLNLIAPADFAFMLQPRPADSNKGSFGHVLVVGGSLGKAGAAAMAGMSALRAGAGLCTVATARSALPTVAGFHPELMTEPLAETSAGTISLAALEYGHFASLAARATVLAIGPGISRHPESVAFVQTIARGAAQPTVLDADGLNAFEGIAATLKGDGRTLVITPHPGEMARLVGTTVAEVQRDRMNVARSFAREHQAIVVLKGHRTLVASPDGEVWVNATGNPGMATGGAGDILTGMIAGMIAQNQSQALQAVIAAVHLHGLAGDIARDDVGEACLVATDLVREMPKAFRRAREEAGQGMIKIGG